MSHDPDPVPLTPTAPDLDAISATLDTADDCRDAHLGLLERVPAGLCLADKAYLDALESAAASTRALLAHCRALTAERDALLAALLPAAAPDLDALATVCERMWRTPQTGPDVRVYRYYDVEAVLSGCCHLLVSVRTLTAERDSLLAALKRPDGG